MDRQGPDIRLIETKHHCIVSRRLLDSSTHQDYVALSYVWGDVKQLYVPSGEAYSVLTNKGALLDLKLSKTIVDAMQLIRQLGLRYLWVDALCIKQGDFSDKEEQITRMEFVYQSALFTIIAASGSTCNAGLPGLRPGTRRVSFPTGSWVDWEGEISFRYFQTYNPVVVSFMIRLDEKGQNTQLVCGPPTGFGARNYDLPLKDAFIITIEAISTAYSIHPLRPNFHIFFYTYSAVFYLMPQGRLILPDHPPRYTYDEKGNLLGFKPDYGYLVPSLDE